MKIAYTNEIPGDVYLKTIQMANKILDDYQKRGYILTIRQLHYRFVANGWAPNTKSQYDHLIVAVGKGRMAGLIDWDMLEDRTRYLMGQTYFESGLDAMEKRRDEFLTDKWLDQEWRPEVWVEKDAQVGIIEPICQELGVNYYSCRGYNSMSECWRAGQRFANYYRVGQRPIVFHLGDHDPSGIHMSEDNSKRIDTFTGVRVTFVRLALTMAQIRKYAPPPNEAKESDARYKSYVDRFGTTECWELDALEPAVVHEIIKEAVLQVRDEKKWDAALLYEATEKQTLTEVVDELTPPEKEGDEE